jgi:hypothetical protein
VVQGKGPKQTRREHLADQIDMYVRRQGRKADRLGDPNDRHVNHALDDTVRRLDPTTMAELLEAAGGDET